jgi:hypothetical protein
MDDRLGRYRLLKLIATGGMGEVFLARQEGPAGFSKIVVVKRILRHHANDQGFIDLFLNEARLAGQLHHPHIAQVFGLEQERGSWFMVMEFVHGRSLRDVLDEASRRGLRVPPRIAVRIVSQALQGLHFAHELKDERGQPLGILHRDVSPENLLVGFSGVVKLVDFGIARAMTGRETRVGQPKGKVAYMAPELTQSGAAIDRRADLYAAGIVLAEALTLARPPNAPAGHESARAPRRAYEPDPQLPEGLNAVLARAMAPEPGQRFQTAQQMSDALEAWLEAQRLTAPAADVAGFLIELFGQQAADMNEGVVPLGAGAGVTAPQALGTQRLSRTSGGQLQRVSTGSPRAQLRLALAVGAATALLCGFAVLIALWPRPPAPTPGVPVVEPGPRDVVLPELALAPPPDDAGARPSDPPPPLAPAKATRPERRAPPARTGLLIVRVNPWAEVLVGGRRYGVTPLPPIELPSGTATVTLTNAQLRVTRKVTVKVPAGGRVVLKADLFTD